MRRRRLRQRLEGLFTGGTDEQTTIVPITEDDRIRVITATRAGRVVKLAIQLECRIRGRWIELRRYDSAHQESYGPLHIHIAPWSKKRDSRQAVPIRGSLGDAIDPLVDQLAADWWDLRTAYEQGMGR